MLSSLKKSTTIKELIETRRNLFTKCFYCISSKYNQAFFRKLFEIQGVFIKDDVNYHKLYVEMLSFYRYFNHIFPNNDKNEYKELDQDLNIVTFNLQEFYLMTRICSDYLKDFLVNDWKYSLE